MLMEYYFRNRHAVHESWTRVRFLGAPVSAVSGSGLLTGSDMGNVA
jgi:hypothetical protein